MKTINPNSIIQLGNHRLAYGDATDPELVNKLIRDDKVNLILTDPPYGVAYVEGKRDFNQSANKHLAIANDHLQTDLEYQYFTSKWLEAVKKSLAPKNAVYIFNSDKMIFALRDGLLDQDFKFAQLLIWLKTQATIGRLDYLPQHELIAYGWYGRHQFRKSKDKSIICYPRTSNNTLHPTMKPVGLLRRLILNSSNVGDIVYDPFGGSGSTLIACEQTKRRCLMIEKSPQYCQIIINRFNKLYGKTK
jgi:DNA modification methylase